MLKYINLLKFFVLILSVYLFSACEKESNSTKLPSADETIKLTEKIANTYIENESEVISHPFLYTGMFQLSKESHYPKYINWLIEKGEKQNWQIPQEDNEPVDYSISQFYLSIFQKPHLGRKELLLPTQNHVRAIIDDTLKTPQWKTPEDLYLQPSVLAKLSRIQKKDSSYNYLNYMHEHYKHVYIEFWDENQNLFLEKSSDNESQQKKSYSTKHNTGVFAGLALLIPELPKDWEHKPFYENLYKKIAISLKSYSKKDGTWALQLQDSDAENVNLDLAGTSFSVFGIAWGISNNLLDKSTYEPLLLKSWNTIKNKVEESNKIIYATHDHQTKGFKTGAFLAAGSKMHYYIKKFYPIDKSTSFTTFMEDGGWCWYQDPRVVISNDKLFIAGLSGVSGDARIGVYDLKEHRQDTTLVLAQKIGIDDHNVPALYKRPDDRILAVWAKHAKEKIHYSSISYPDDYKNWSEIDTFQHKYNKGPGVTYMNLYYLEDQDKLYNFFRDGSNFNPTFITSSDQGETWGNRTHFISNDVEGFQRPYAKYLQVDDNTIGISYTDAHPRKFGNNLYYVEYKDNKFYTAKGDLIQNLEDGPLPSSSAEKIYSGGDTMKKPPTNESVPNSAWTTTMAKDENNHPHIGYTLYLNDNDIRFRIASWDGKQWNDREIAYAGKSLYKIESSYSGLLAFDPEDPTSVFISTDVNPSTGEDLGGNHEIYRAKIGPEDDISTIQWEAVTSNSPHRNIRPIVVSEDGYKVILWLYGPWKTFKNYDVNVVGKMLAQPE